jgi:putative DNA methylase
LSRQKTGEGFTKWTSRLINVELADYLTRKLETSRPDEAGAARILRELVKHQRLG